MNTFTADLKISFGTGTIKIKFFYILFLGSNSWALYKAKGSNRK